MIQEVPAICLKSLYHATLVKLSIKFLESIDYSRINKRESFSSTHCLVRLYGDGVQYIRNAPSPSKHEGSFAFIICIYNVHLTGNTQ